MWIFVADLCQISFKLYCSFSIESAIKAYGKYEIPVKLYGSEIQGKINVVVTEK